MLKPIPGRETMQHLCDFMKCGGEVIRFDKPRNYGEPFGIEVYIHDIHPYIMVSGSNKRFSVNYCPFCGVSIDDDRG